MCSVLAITVSSVASAEGFLHPTLADRRDHSTLSALAGMGTPAGELGIAYAQAVHHNVDVAVSGGYGKFWRSGVQFGAMPRLRARLNGVTFALGAGLSVGKYTAHWPHDSSDSAISTLFRDIEGSIQVTSRRGPFARLFFGVSKPLAFGAHGPGMELDYDSAPYLGTSLGWAL
jgi:hypothetical protein